MDRDKARIMARQLRLISRKAGMPDDYCIARQRISGEYRISWATPGGYWKDLGEKSGLLRMQYLFGKTRIKGAKA